ncbi:MAG: hypothetical protein P8J87_13690, partial [Verrucomicrobiales bacterium]|nr:hypothetical protein [Verrucomicrobiales bacterium]
LTIEGRLDPGGDVDLFAIPLESGTTLNARVLAYALGSPIDPLLHIRDASGTRLKFNHDATGTTLDPTLSFTAPSTSTYTVQLAAFAHPPQANIRFAGSAISVYRLTLDLAPPAPIPIPDEPETLEFPSAFTGTIGTPGQIDSYKFTTRKDAHHQFTVTATSLGYHTDPVLRILDASGKALKTADDIDTKSNLDVSLDWKSPADGSYTAEVTDRFNAGSPHHAYQFLATTPPPSFEVTTPDHAWTINPGENLEIKLSLKRHHGHTADITVTAKNLPPGLTAEPVSTFDKKGAATLKITSTHETQPLSAPIGLIASNNPVTHSIIPATTDPGDLLITHTSDLWITITSKKVLVKDSQ